MSNPAVIKLQSGKLGKRKVWLDDNFGESIHIHIDDSRVDLSVEEFRQMYEDLCDSINALISVEGFDVRKIDPVFFSAFLWSRLPHLTGVANDTVSLGKMLAPVQSKIVPLSESMGVKALKGLSNENNSVSRKSHHIGQDDNERMAAILKSVKENGYPYEDHLIVLYGDDTIIRDGQHRASCLYYLYGDIEVPVLRLYFDNYRSPQVDKHYNSKIRVYLRRHTLKKAKSAVRKTKSFLRKTKRKLFSRSKAQKKRGELAVSEGLATIFNAK